MSKSNYSLKDYKQLKTPFCFLDETGQLNNKHDRFFALGMIKCSQPFYLYKKINELRDKTHFYDEIKFNKLSQKSLDVNLKTMDFFFNTPGVKFSCIVLKKDELDFDKHFQGDCWRAYESFAIQQLRGNISKNEILSVLADYVCTPPYIKFEVNVKRRVNEYFKRLAVHGVCRLDSRGTQLLQVTDLLLGVVVYDFKLGSGLIRKPFKPKHLFLKNLKATLNCSSLAKGFRTKKFNVWVFDGKRS